MVPRTNAEVHRQMIACVRARAAARGIALSHLADFAGVSRSHFFDVLAGRKSPTLEWLGRVAGALDADVVELLAPEP